MSNFNLVHSLKKKEIIDAIKEKNPESVKLRHGVWNKYKSTDTESAIASVKNCDYGADLYYDSDEDMYYVSIPVSSDMW